MQDSTIKSRPRNLRIVLALVGDSTMTSLRPPSLFPAWGLVFAAFFTAFFAIQCFTVADVSALKVLQCPGCSIYIIRSTIWSQLPHTAIPYFNFPRAVLTQRAEDWPAPALIRNITRH